MSAATITKKRHVKVPEMGIFLGENSIDELVPVPLAQLVDLEFVESHRYYDVVVQVGANQRWREASGGSWRRAPEKDVPGSGVKQMTHVPALTKVRAVPGEILNGLIQSHNEWLKANRQNDIMKGDVSKQLMVVGIVPTAKPASLRNDDLVQTVVAAVMAAMAPLIEKLSSERK